MYAREPRRGRTLALGLVASAAVACGSTAGSPDDGAEAGGDGMQGRVASPDGAAGAPEAGPSRDAGASVAPNDAMSSGASDVVVQDAELLGDGGGDRSFTVTNRCAQTVWAAALPATTFPGTTVEMAPGFSFRVGVSDGWSGRIWGKTRCAAANGKLACASDAFPSSLAELTLTTSATGLDFYDVSLVDGFNLPIELAAVGHVPDAGHPYDCGAPACPVDLNASCPAVLEDISGAAVLACANDECRVLGGNDASSPDCAYPNSYTEFFKTACPTAYSYPSDDATSTFTCRGQNSYAVVFCP